MVTALVQQQRSPVWDSAAASLQRAKAAAPALSARAVALVLLARCVHAAVPIKQQHA